MDFIELVELLGQDLEHPAIIGHFRESNITEQPKPEVGEPMAYVQFPEQGYEMRFDLRPGGVQLFLSSLTAYPNGDATYKPFRGALPLGIQGDDTQQSLRDRLGTPAIHNKTTNVDAWTLAENNVVVRYDKSTGTVKNVYATVPRK